MLTRAVKSPIFWYWTHNKNITNGHIGQQCVQFSNIAKSAKSPHPKVQSKAALKTVAFLAVKEEQFANNFLYKFVNNFAHRWCQFPVGFNFCAADVSAFPDKQFRVLAPSFEKKIRFIPYMVSSILFSGFVLGRVVFPTIFPFSLSTFCIVQYANLCAHWRPSVYSLWQAVYSLTGSLHIPSHSVHWKW